MNFFRTLKYILIFPTTLPLVSCAQKKDIIWNITEVHDGDTFKSGNNKIRLFGIDTPEMNNQYLDFDQTKGLERLYAEQATEYVKKRILNKDVIVDKMTTDKYDRIVAKIFLYEDIGLGLIKMGLARVAYISLDKSNPFYTTDTDYYKKLLREQHRAFVKNIGLWVHKDKLKEIFPKS